MPTFSLGTPGYPDPGQLFASQNIPQGPQPLNPHLAQSLMRAQQQGAPSSSGGLGGSMAVPSPWLGGHPAAVASSAPQVPQGPRGGSAGAVVANTSGRPPKRADVSPERVESVAAAGEKRRKQNPKCKAANSALRDWVRKTQIDPHVPQGLDKDAKVPCPLCKEQMPHSSLESHIIQKHLSALEGDMPDGVRPGRYPCRYPGCGALKHNHRPDALADHEGTVHGVDAPKKRYSTDEKYLKRKCPAVLRGHNLSDGKELNALKERVREAERQLAERLPQYESRHGLDLDTTYPTEEGALPKSKATLIEDLIKLRTDGSKKGKLLCQSGKEGTWSEVLEDLMTALRRVQAGQAPDEQARDDEGEQKEEDGEGGTYEEE